MITDVNVRSLFRAETQATARPMVTILRSEGLLRSSTHSFVLFGAFTPQTLDLDTVCVEGGGRVNVASLVIARSRLRIPPCRSIKRFVLLFVSVEDWI